MFGSLKIDRNHFYHIHFTCGLFGFPDRVSLSWNFVEHAGLKLTGVHLWAFKTFLRDNTDLVGLILRARMTSTTLLLITVKVFAGPFRKAVTRASTGNLSVGQMQHKAEGISV